MGALRLYLFDTNDCHFSAVQNLYISFTSNYLPNVVAVVIVIP